MGFSNLFFTNRNVGATTVTATGSSSTGEIFRFQADSTDPNGGWDVNDILEQRITYDQNGGRVTTWYNVTKDTAITTNLPTVKADAIPCGDMVDVEEFTATIGTTAETLEEILVRITGGPVSIATTVDAAEISVNSGQVRSTVLAANTPSFTTPSGRLTSAGGGIIVRDRTQVLNGKYVSDGSSEIHVLLVNIAKQ